MKKILFMLAIAMPLFAVAQPKNPDEALKAIDKALVDTQNPKKNTKAATWIKLAEAYVNAYDYPSRNLLPNTPQMEVKMFLKDQQILSTETYTGAEGTYNVDVYADKKLYYNNKGLLEFYIVTKPVLENALDKAIDAYLTAAKSEGAKLDKLVAPMNSIHDKLNTEAFNMYLFGDYAAASKLFEKTAKTFGNSINKNVDSLSIYYAGVMSYTAGNNTKKNLAKATNAADSAAVNSAANVHFIRAIEILDAARQIGFYQDGSVFSNLADAYKQMGKVEKCKETLEQGFVAYPENQGILVGLINLYIETNDDPEKLFNLLHTAQANEPTNASLYYVEGDVHKKLGNTEKAVEFFKKSSEVDPNYIFGTLNIGILYYDKAVEYSEKASSEFDDAKYNALMDKVNENLIAAIEPFEASFEKAKEVEIKVAIAEYLKNIYFRFRDKSADYQTSYDKYNEFVKHNQN